MLNKVQKEKITKLRNANKSYKEIADEMNRTKESIKKWCQRNGLGGSKGIKTLKEREEDFKKRFEEKFPTFEYISGYKMCNSKVNIKCKVCGSIKKRSAGCVREGHTKPKCDKCELVERLKRIIKNNIRSIKYMKKIKKRKFYNQAIKPEVEILRRIKSNHRYYKKCTECEKGFFASRADIITCSNSCQNHRNNRIKEIKRRKKLKKNGVVNYDISLLKLIERDDYLCQLCGQPIDKDDFYYSKEGHFIAGPNYPSVDHIIPVAKGGTHTWDNVQLAHRHCNTIKGDDSLIEIKDNRTKIYY